MKKNNIYSVDRAKGTLVDNITDEITYNFAKFLVKHTNITANQISVLAFILFTVPAVILFSFGGYVYSLFALILCFGYHIFDFIDGKIARLRSLETELGEWLESGLDWLNTNLIPIGISIGILHNRTNSLTIIIIIIFIALLNINTHISSTFERKFDFYSNKDKIKKWYDNVSKENGASVFDIFTKNVLNPHGFFFYFFFSIRYILFLGIIFNHLFYAIFLLTGTFVLKCGLMYYLFIVYMRNQEKEPLIVKELRKISS